MIQYLKNSFVISMDYNKLCQFYKWFTMNSIYPLPQHFNAFKHPKLSGPENCSLSHAAIVTMAKTMHLPYVCIFEDDAYPCIDSAKILNELTNIPDDCGLLVLGWCSVGNAIKFKQQTFNSKYNRITNYIGGSQSYIIFKQSYDEYLQKYANNRADGIFKDIKNSYILNQPIFIQYSIDTSMNKHKNYIFNGDNCIPPKNFPKVEIYG